MKICIKCKKNKPVSEFYRNKRKKDKRDTYCKKCRKLMFNRANKNAYERERHSKYPCLKRLAGIKQRCYNPNNNRYAQYGARGIKCKITLEELRLLWKRDNASSQYQPSIDRINPDGDYEYDNCRFIELSENSKRARFATRTVKQYDLNNKFIKEFKSVTEAAKAVNLKHKSAISACLNKRQITAGGFKWK